MKIKVLLILLFCSIIYAQDDEFDIGFGNTQKIGFYMVNYNYMPIEIVSNNSPYTATAFFGGDNARNYGRIPNGQYFSQMAGTPDSFTIFFRAKFYLPTETSQFPISTSNNTWAIDFRNAYANDLCFNGGGVQPKLTSALMDSVRHKWLVKYNSGIGIRTYQDGVRTDSVGKVWNGSYNANYYICFGGYAVGSVTDTTTPVAGTYFYGEMDSVVIAKWDTAIGGTNRDTILHIPFNEGFGQVAYCYLTTKQTGASETTRDTICSRLTIDRSNYDLARGVNDWHVTRGWGIAPDKHDWQWKIQTGSRPSYIDTAGFGTWLWETNPAATQIYGESFILDLDWLNDSTIIIANGRSNVINPANKLTRGDTANYISLLHWNRINKDSKVYTTLSNTNYPRSTVYSVCTYNGDIIAGMGDSIIGVARTFGLARWDVDTAAWKSVDSSFVSGAVYQINAYGNALIAMGGFNQIGITTGFNNVAIMRTPYSEWAKLGTGFNGAVWNCIVASNGDTIFTGNFSTANGVSAVGIAKWTGSTFTAYGTGITDSNSNAGIVYCVANYKGNIYAGGDFDKAGGNFAHGFAMWNGSVWSEPFACYNGNWTNHLDANIVELKVAKVYKNSIQVDSVLVGVGSMAWVGGKQCRHGFIYNGKDVYPLQSDLRNEDMVFNYSGDTTKIIRVGDLYSEYGVEGQNIIIDKITFR